VASLGAAASPRFYGGGSVGKLVRSSNPSLRAVVFGAYGQVGRGVVSLLAGNGVQCVVPWRGDDMEWRHLKVMGDIGVVAPMPFSPRDEASIDRAMEGCDIVVNLIGKDFETKHYVPNLVNFSYEEVHVTLAERLARKAVQHGASTFVHVSALAADPFALSAWARSKARGEEAVRAAAPGATIIRPADVFGPEDRFLNLFARMYALFPRVVLVNEGSARVQPLFVHDLAQAIFKVAMSEDPEVMLGQTYDLAGPEEYTYREVVEYVFESVRADRPEVANVSPAVADAIGFVNGLMPQWIRNPLVTRDTFLRMQADVVLDDREYATGGLPSPCARAHARGSGAHSPSPLSSFNLSALCPRSCSDEAPARPWH
jgi:NADH dehydrogenase (ubiquinone) 1 alpha subcomplex subunit 9